MLRTSPPLARFYAERPPFRPQGLEARVLALAGSIATRLGRPAPVTDAAVHGAARDICRGLLPAGPPPAALVDFALRSHGLVEPSPHLVVAEIVPGREDELLDQVRGRLERILGTATFTRVGIGVAVPALVPGRQRLVVALLESRVRLRPLPRALLLGQTARLELRVSPGLAGITLIVADPGGAVAPRPLRREGERYLGELHCRRPGVYQVEVTGEGRHGYEVLANFPVHCGEAPPRQVRYEAALAAGESAEALEREIFARTNAIRREQRLPLFRWSASVAGVARAHSLDMQRAGFVGHVSPTTGSPADRLRRGGVVHLVARENVARAYSAAEVVAELMKSPAHRGNILSTDVSDLGVGVAVERGGPLPVLLVTQNFIRPGTAFDPRTAQRDLLRLVAAARRSAGLPALAEDPQLTRLCTRYVETVVDAAGRQEGADRELTLALRRLGGRFRKVEGLLVRLQVIDSLAGAEELRRRGPTHLGLGAARLGDQVVVFILLGVR